MINSDKLIIFLYQFLDDSIYRVSGTTSSRAHGQIENAAALSRPGKLKQLILLN